MGDMGSVADRGPAGGAGALGNTIWGGILSSVGRGGGDGAEPDAVGILGAESSGARTRQERRSTQAEMGDFWRRSAGGGEAGRVDEEAWGARDTAGEHVWNYRD